MLLVQVGRPSLGRIQVEQAMFRMGQHIQHPVERVIVPVVPAVPPDLHVRVFIVLCLGEGQADVRAPAGKRAGKHGPHLAEVQVADPVVGREGVAEGCAYTSVGAGEGEGAAGDSGREDRQTREKSSSNSDDDLEHKSNMGMGQFIL
ncbi:UDP-N-acetylglucosamine 1-carboxyvinyltransferase2 [Striga asiatica]|uniref:UDP-N-acetylglucosamine 1-carboxyvinyltransferase2 n=1 Tax=Striga asiatica TaxID=4170 RepID=A0A5A7Q6D4_STRAF|nr:UDP-N-acetylglucosamine 1-carboxyvinyltransferase2 [Striga asiatica]